MNSFGKMRELCEKVRVWGLPGVLSYFRREVNARILRRRLRRLCAASPQKAPQRGITVIGDLTEFPGLSKTLRDFVWSLKDAGIPVQTFDTTWRPRISEADKAGLLTPLAEFDLHRYSHIVEMYRSPLSKEMARGHTVAKIVFHDSAHGIHSTAPFLKASGDDIIAMSDFNYEYFKRAFPGQNVWKVVYPFRFRERDAAPRAAVRRKFGIGDGDFAVFFNFDFGSYYRKNIPAAIKAFALAFGGEPTAKLVFKTKGAEENRRQAAEMLAIVGRLGIAGNLIHFPDLLPKAEVDGLTGACDVYLSLHKSEGFGLGMAEAMAQGVPVVATGWSANLEFCRPDTAWLVPFKMVPILPHEYPVAMREWAEADPVAASEALREIRANPAAAQARAAVGKAFMAEHFSVANFKRDVDRMLDGVVNG